MKKNSASIAAVVTCTLLISLGCGESSGSRHLQSIAANTTGMTQFQLTATGTFSASPTNVNPLPVAWYIISPSVDYQAGPVAYTLTSQPYSTPCKTGFTAVAIAPQSPSAATSGTIPNKVWLDLAVAQTTTVEGGFIASPGQQIFCP